MISFDIANGKLSYRLNNTDGSQSLSEFTLTAPIIKCELVIGNEMHQLDIFAREKQRLLLEQGGGVPALVHLIASSPSSTTPSSYSSADDEQSTNNGGGGTSGGDNSLCQYDTDLIGSNHGMIRALDGQHHIGKYNNLVYVQDLNSFSPYHNQQQQQQSKNDVLYSKLRHSEPSRIEYIVNKNQKKTVLHELDNDHSDNDAFMKVMKGSAAKRADGSGGGSGEQASSGGDAKSRRQGSSVNLRPFPISAHLFNKKKNANGNAQKQRAQANQPILQTVQDMFLFVAFFFIAVFSVRVARLVVECKSRLLFLLSRLLFGIMTPLLN